MSECRARLRQLLSCRESQHCTVCEQLNVSASLLLLLFPSFTDAFDLPLTLAAHAGLPAALLHHVPAGAQFQAPFPAPAAVTSGAAAGAAATTAAPQVAAPILGPVLGHVWAL